MEQWKGQQLVGFQKMGNSAKQKKGRREFVLKQCPGATLPGSQRQGQHLWAVQDAFLTLFGWVQWGWYTADGLP